MPSPRQPAPQQTVKRESVLERERRAVIDAERALEEATIPVRPLQEREQQLEVAIRNTKEAAASAVTVEAITQAQDAVRTLETELKAVQKKQEGAEAILARLTEATHRARADLAAVEKRVHTLDNPFGGSLQVQRGVIATQKRVIADRERQVQAERETLVTMERRLAEIETELRDLRGGG